MRASLLSTTASCIALASSGRQQSNLLDSSSTRASIRASRGASSVGLGVSAARVARLVMEGLCVLERLWPLALAGESDRLNLIFELARRLSLRVIGEPSSIPRVTTVTKISHPQPGRRLRVVSK